MTDLLHDHLRQGVFLTHDEIDSWPGPRMQARANRVFALNAWLAGGDGNRWDGDDGRPLDLVDFQFWPQKIKDAELAKFGELDEVYDSIKPEMDDFDAAIAEVSGDDTKQLHHDILERTRRIRAGESIVEDKD
jgi:hypothetical protein